MAGKKTISYLQYLHCTNVSLTFSPMQAVNKSKGEDTCIGLGYLGLFGDDWLKVEQCIVCVQPSVLFYSCGLSVMGNSL